jgi:lipoate-protein ligase A
LRGITPVHKSSLAAVRRRTGGRAICHIR